jgi:hypothetical protein
MFAALDSVSDFFKPGILDWILDSTSVLLAHRLLAERLDDRIDKLFPQPLLFEVEAFQRDLKSILLRIVIMTNSRLFRHWAHSFFQSFERALKRSRRGDNSWSRNLIS